MGPILFDIDTNSHVVSRPVIGVHLYFVVVATSISAHRFCHLERSIRPTRYPITHNRAGFGNPSTGDLVIRLEQVSTGFDSDWRGGHGGENMGFTANEAFCRYFSSARSTARVPGAYIRCQEGSVSRQKVEEPGEKAMLRFSVSPCIWSPFERNVLASTSYDMTCRV